MNNKINEDRDNEDYITEDRIIPLQNPISEKHDFFMCKECKRFPKFPSMCKNCNSIFCNYCMSQKSNMCECSCKLQPLTEGIQNSFRQIQVRCKYRMRGCKYFLKLGELERHEKQCEFQRQQDGNNLESENNLIVCEKCGISYLEREKDLHFCLPIFGRKMQNMLEQFKDLQIQFNNMKEENLTLQKKVEILEVHNQELLNEKKVKSEGDKSNFQGPNIEKELVTQQILSLQSQNEHIVEALRYSHWLSQRNDMPLIPFAFQCYSTNLFFLDILTWTKLKLSIKNVFVPNSYSALIQINRRIYICGGRDKNGHIMNLTFEFILPDFETRAPMQQKKEDHSLVGLKEKIIYCIGGNDGNWSWLDLCEKYSIADDAWIKVPYLNEKKSWTALSEFRERYIYCFGGNDTSKILECLDTDHENEGWKFMKLNLNEGWTSRAGSNAIQITKDEILIFGGGFQRESFVFNIEKLQIKKHKSMVKYCDFYNHFITPFKIGYNVYAPDNNLNLNIYSMIEESWSLIPKSHWT